LVKKTKTNLEELKDKIDISSDSWVVEDVFDYFDGLKLFHKFKEPTMQKIEEIKRIYNIGKQFAENQIKGQRKKSVFMNPDNINDELNIIKMIYSRASYFRYKKLAKELGYIQWANILDWQYKLMLMEKKIEVREKRNS